MEMEKGIRKGEKREDAGTGAGWGGKLCGQQGRTTPSGGKDFPTSVWFHRTMEKKAGE